MANQMLYLHWRTVRLGLLPLALAAFGAPLVVARQVAGAASHSPERAVVNALEAGQLLLPVFPGLAAAVGFTLALTAWSWDHRTGHVYALSLPVSRARYALLKFGAGAVLALLPAACLLLGALLAGAAVELPPGLRAYPTQLGARFLFAVLLSYALLFALAAGTIRTTVLVLTVCVAIPVLWSLGLQLLGEAHPLAAALPRWDQMLEWTLLRAGPFRILAGNWMLVDV